jgi:hypothetical protein
MRAVGCAIENTRKQCTLHAIDLLLSRSKCESVLHIVGNGILSWVEKPSGSNKLWSDAINDWVYPSASLDFSSNIRRSRLQHFLILRDSNDRVQAPSNYELALRRILKDKLDPVFVVAPSFARQKGYCNMKWLGLEKQDTPSKF